jgi:hypothetical protein
VSDTFSLRSRERQLTVVLHGVPEGVGRRLAAGGEHRDAMTLAMASDDLGVVDHAVRP